MKNKIIFPALALSLLLMTSCGSTESSQEESTASDSIDYSKVEIAQAVFDELYSPFDQIISEAEIIMIGEVMDDGIADVKYQDPENKIQPYTSNTLQTLKVIKVFKGAELIEGDTVKAYDNYAFINYPDGTCQLSMVTNLAPLFKGDKAIFLLSYNDYMQRYIPLGTYGRFPLPEDRGKVDRLGFVDGLVTGVKLNEENYKKLLEMYDIT